MVNEIIYVYATKGSDTKRIPGNEFEGLMEALSYISVDNHGAYDEDGNWLSVMVEYDTLDHIEDFLYEYVEDESLRRDDHVEILDKLENIIKTNNISTLIFNFSNSFFSANRFHTGHLVFDVDGSRRIIDASSKALTIDKRARTLQHAVLITDILRDSGVELMLEISKDLDEFLLSDTNISIKLSDYFNDGQVNTGTLLSDLKDEYKEHIWTLFDEEFQRLEEEY